MKTAGYFAIVASALVSASAHGQGAMSAGPYSMPAPTAQPRSTIATVPTTTQHAFVNGPCFQHPVAVQPCHRPNVVFVPGCPVSYPVYYGSSYYSGYSYAPGYYNSAVYNHGYYASDSSYSVSQKQQLSYYQLGEQWGQDLRREIVTWEQFVAYLKAYIVTAAEAQRDEFRRGFIAGYNTNAEAAFNKAMTEAGTPTSTGPKVITGTPKGSGSTY